MKKLVCLVLVVMMALSAVSAFAAKDVLFRNIPWGSSIADSVNALKVEFGDDVTFKTEEFDGFSFPLSSQVEYKHFGNVGIVSDYSYPEYYFGTKVTLSVPGLKVAGFKVSSSKLSGLNSPKSSVLYGQEYFDGDNVILYFIPLLNQEGTSYSLEEGRLFAAEYVTFTPTTEIDLPSISNEISSKLKGLYGKKPIEVRYTSNKNLRERIWIIGNSMITLRDPYSRYSSYPTTTLFYSTKSLKDEMITIYHLKANNDKNEKEAEREKEQQDAEERGSDGL